MSFFRNSLQDFCVVGTSTLLKYAKRYFSFIKVLRDVPKARREVELHYMACQHKHIVRIYDVYENTYNQVKCLLVVMECMEGSLLFLMAEATYSSQLLLMLSQFFNTF